MSISSIITNVTKVDAMAPIVGLEMTVTGGRTIQAYKRGGEDEARERFIEEGTGALVWLGGVKILNKLGDKILKFKFGENFDVGTDKVLRTPFENFKKNHSNIGSSAVFLKAAKVLTSVLLADAFIGLVVPPLNQKLTRNLAIQKKVTENNNQQDKLELSTKNQQNPSFKGGGFLNAVNVFTNAIENTNTGKLLSTDVGLVSGRMYSARNNQERKEIAIRDIGSIYFYMWAQSHAGSLMNFAETGRFTRLDPTSAEIFTKYLEEFVTSKGGELSVDDFKKLVLGKADSEIKLPEGIKFETAEISKIAEFFDKFRATKTEPLQVAKVEDLKEIFTDKEIFARIEKMSGLQPARQGVPVVTKQQIIDAVNISELNNSKLLNEVFLAFSEGKSNKEYSYFSNTKLYDLKARMVDYVNDLCNLSKDGKVNKDLLGRMKNRNIGFNGLNFAVGFAFAALFLSTLIPKFQYWYTRHTTGMDAFPGTYEL